MCPGLASDDKADVGLIDSVVICDAFLGFAGCVSAPDFADIVLGQLRVVSIYSARLALALYHVCGVFGMGSNEQVRRVAAFSVIARVAYEHPLREFRAIRQFPCHRVRRAACPVCGTAAHIEDAVTPGQCACPFPAFIGRTRWRIRAQAFGVVDIAGLAHYRRVIQIGAAEMALVVRVAHPDLACFRCAIFNRTFHVSTNSIK